MEKMENLTEYELILMISPRFTAEETEKEVNRVKDLAASKGAQEIELEHWGRRKIAYKINKQDSAHYAVLYFKSNQNSIVSDLTALLRINDAIVKFQFHRCSDRVRKFQGNPRRLKNDPSLQTAVDTRAAAN